MPLLYRTARSDELERAQALVVTGINDLTTRHGFGPIANVRPPLFQAFSLRDDPGALWVAEENSDLLGFAFSWVCGDRWFLAELFVAPGHQGRGIGNELLQRTLQHAQKAGAANKALITFSFNTVSQGLYIRHGMFPRTPVYNLGVARDVLLGRLQGEQLRAEPLENSASHLEALTQIDARALGLSRDKHHKFLLADNAMKGALLFEGRTLAGYAYVASTGHIGPLAVMMPGAAGAAFRTALRLAANLGAPQVSAFVPGTAEAALSIAIESGMRIGFPMLLMSSHDFGDWRSYLPRNPGFM
jgi:ribosomal protein S18 acetylase RimI-like enzyme